MNLPSHSCLGVLLAWGTSLPSHGSSIHGRAPPATAENIPTAAPGGLAALAQESFPRVRLIKIPVSEQCSLSISPSPPGPMQPLLASVELLGGRCGYPDVPEGTAGYVLYLIQTICLKVSGL